MCVHPALRLGPDPDLEALPLPLVGETHFPLVPEQAGRGGFGEPKCLQGAHHPARALPLRAQALVGVPAGGAVPVGGVQQVQRQQALVSPVLCGGQVV